MDKRTAAEALTLMIVERSLDNYCNQLANEAKDRSYFDKITDYASEEYRRIYTHIFTNLDSDNRNAP